MRKTKVQLETYIDALEGELKAADGRELVIDQLRAELTRLREVNRELLKGCKAGWDALEEAMNPPRGVDIPDWLRPHWQKLCNAVDTIGESLEKSKGL